MDIIDRYDEKQRQADDQTVLLTAIRTAVNILATSRTVRARNTDQERHAAALKAENILAKALYTVEKEN